MNTTWLIIWLAGVIIFGIVEGATIQLVAIWFAVGSVGALAACSLGAPVWAQLTVFLALSALLLAFLRPIIKRFEVTRLERTNVDALIGKTAVVTEDIDNAEQNGAARISGVTWTARSLDGSKITVGSNVTIERVEGAKLIVSKL